MNTPWRLAYFWMLAAIYWRLSGRPDIAAAFSLAAGVSMMLGVVMPHDKRPPGGGTP